MYPYTHISGPRKCANHRARCSKNESAIYKYVYIYIHTYTHTHTHTCIHILTYQALESVKIIGLDAVKTKVQYANMCIYTYTHTHTHTPTHITGPRKCANHRARCSKNESAYV